MFKSHLETLDFYIGVEKRELVPLFKSYFCDISQAKGMLCIEHWTDEQELSWAIGQLRTFILWGCLEIPSWVRQPKAVPNTQPNLKALKKYDIPSWFR